MSKTTITGKKQLTDRISNNLSKKRASLTKTQIEAVINELLTETKKSLLKGEEVRLQVKEYPSMKSKKKIINYSVGHYPCNVIINGRWFTELEISQYYRTKPGRSTVSDEIIQELVKQLNDEEDLARDKKYYSFEPLFIDHRAYNLVWDYDEEEITSTLIIIDCYRERKFDLLKRMQQLGYRRINQGLTPNATPLEKSKYEICQSILRYKREKNLSEQELGEKLGIKQVDKLEYLLFRHINYFTLDELVDYASDLFTPFHLAIHEEPVKKNDSSRKILKEEFLIPAQISSTQLARDINVSSKVIKEIIAEERDLNKDIATRLALYFGTAPTFWINLQSNYDEEQDITFIHKG
ncbi:608_t:CDS:2 [Ambispora gerdemannii]|uniref:608_t:CDS:1 n=1 Tax=Ambispora gerdemannii TaxID=144530 RepID=A0A9N9EI18_9GLOM|nr:608_t:CDS:2 [Ambispora gerdemannii]